MNVNLNNIILKYFKMKYRCLMKLNGRGKFQYNFNIIFVNRNHPSRMKIYTATSAIEFSYYILMAENKPSQIINKKIYEQRLYNNNALMFKLKISNLYNEI